VVGILKLRSSLGHVGALIQSLLVSKIATSMAGVLALILVLYLFVSRTLIHPIKTLERAMARVNAGDLDARVNIHRSDEMGRLGDGFNRMAEALSTVIEEAAERSRLQEECRLASMIQQALLPGGEAELPSLSIASSLVTSTEVGGDYYDYFILPEPGCYGLCVGDATGHGLAAGTVVTAAKGALFSLVAGGVRSPAEALHLLTQAIRQTARGQAFMTFLFAVIDTRAQRLTYANAGHNFPYIYRAASGKLEELTLGGLPLGFKSSAVASAEVRTWLFAGEGMQRYEECEIPFCPGDILLAYSDGLVEGENPKGEAYDYPRLESSICRHGHLRAREICRNILDDAFRFYSGQSPDDDITLLVVKHVVRGR
jgi:serine phosphatase RsbU (regulator of sigma subunit)